MEAGAVAAGEEIGEIFPLVSPLQHGLQVVADLTNIKIEAASSSKEEELSLKKERELGLGLTPLLATVFPTTCLLSYAMGW